MWYIKSVVVWCIILLTTTLVFLNSINDKWGMYRPHKVSPKDAFIFLMYSCIPVLRVVAWAIIILIGVYDASGFRKLFGDEFTDELISALEENKRRIDSDNKY